jgi:P63C domain
MTPPATPKIAPGTSWRRFWKPTSLLNWPRGLRSSPTSSSGRCLHGWHYKPGETRGPRYIGKFITKYVWGGLPANVVEEIKLRNPANEKGQRPKKMFQFLTDETGIPHLDWQISTVTTLMRASQDKEQFEELHGRAFQKETQMRLPYNDPKHDGEQATGGPRS